MNNTSASICHHAPSSHKEAGPYLCVAVFAARIVREEFNAFTRPTRTLLPAGDNPAREAEEKRVRDDGVRGGRLRGSEEQTCTFAHLVVLNAEPGATCPAGALRPLIS